VKDAIDIFLDFPIGVADVTTKQSSGTHSMDALLSPIKGGEHRVKATRSLLVNMHDDKHIRDNDFVHGFNSISWM
jgi:hypothetical protein